MKKRDPQPGNHESALPDLITGRMHENFDLFSSYINPPFVKLLRLAGFARRFVSASGFEMTDDRGVRYLDFVSGYGSINIGHNHPAVRDAIKSVIDMGLPSFTQVECGITAGLAAEALVSVLPAGLNRVYFCSSGSEAVDAALKLARAVTGKKRIICCEGAFHGNTLGVLAMADNPHRKNRFRPLLPGVVRIPFNNTEALEAELKWKDTAAFVVEPLLGEGGCVEPAPSYLHDALELCHRRGALLVADEVQTGLGRTGRMFAVEHGGVQPDAIALAKSLGGGFVPAAAMVTSGRHFDKAYGSMGTCLDHKNTFGGSPLAMAAVMATLKVLREENLAELARSTGAQLKLGLQKLAEKHEIIEEVRGTGLMLGIRFRGLSIPGLRAFIPRNSLRAGAELFAQHVVLELLHEHNIITQVAANDFSLLKIMPPLAVTPDAAEQLVNALDSVLSGGGYANAVMTMARRIYSGGKATS